MDSAWARWPRGHSVSAGRRTVNRGPLRRAVLNHAEMETQGVARMSCSACRYEDVFLHPLPRPGRVRRKRRICSAHKDRTGVILVTALRDGKRAQARREKELRPSCVPFLFSPSARYRRANTQPRPGHWLRSAQDILAIATTIAAAPPPPAAGRELRASCEGLIPSQCLRAASDRLAGPSS